MLGKLFGVVVAIAWFSWLVMILAGNLHAAFGWPTLSWQEANSLAIPGLFLVAGIAVVAEGAKS